MVLLLFFRNRIPIFAIPLKKGPLDVAQLVAHLVRDQEVAGSSPVIQTRKSEPFRPGLFSCPDDTRPVPAGGLDPFTPAASRLPPGAAGGRPPDPLRRPVGLRIHLHADNVQSSAMTTPDHYTTYHFGRVSETFIEPGTERDYYISIFALSEDQVSLLENQAIKKMHISLGHSYLEKPSGLKKLSRWLSKSATLIRERSQKPLGVHKSITDGF